MWSSLVAGAGRECDPSRAALQGMWRHLRASLPQLARHYDQVLYLNIAILSRGLLR